MELPFGATWSWVYLGLLGLFAIIFVVFVATIVRDSMKRSSSTRAAESAPAVPDAKPGSLAEALLNPDAGPESFLCRFVKNGRGETAGETLGIHGDRVILKKNDKFLSVSLNAVDVRGDELVAPDVDWAAATRDGEAWRASHKDAIVYDDAGMPMSPAASNRA